MPKKQKHQSKHASKSSKSSLRNARSSFEAFALDGAEQEGVSRTDLPASHYVQGLANEQHMCFANAVLQLLASSAQLNSKEAVAELESQHAVGPALSRALAAVNAFKADEQPADARPLLQHIARKRPDMDGQTQQDSHEALMLLLGLLDDEATAARRDAGQSADEAGDAEAEPSLLRRLVEGSISSQVTCCTCKTLSESKQPMWVMSLPLPPSAAGAPDDADAASRPLHRSATSRSGQLGCETPSEKRGRKGAPKERDKERVKDDRKVSRKEAKAAEKRERRNQRRERKLEKQRQESGMDPEDSSDADASGDDDDVPALRAPAQPSEHRDVPVASQEAGTEVATSPNASLSPIRCPSPSLELQAPPRAHADATEHTTTLFATGALPADAAGPASSSPRSPAQHSTGLNGDAASGSQLRGPGDAAAVPSAASALPGADGVAPCQPSASSPLELRADSASTQLERTGALLSSMDLAASMRQKHGWSAPWLPGLWLMPDGTLFGAGDASCSLLLALQLYFEKEAGVEWRCPVGAASAARARARRGGAAHKRVSIAEREARERLHLIPGFSEATSRALPSMPVWQQLAAGLATWERMWTDPENPDEKKVIQVAMTSIARWFNNQHPSDDEAFNDTAASERLPDDVDCFEVTLNDDRGTQYIETHQLAVPPVRCLDPRSLAFLARVAARARMVSPEEHARGEVIVESIVLKAQMLLKCAHDGLEAAGLAACGELFAAPVLLDEGAGGELAVLGTVSPGGGGGADINEVDVRARYMRLGPDWDDGVGEGVLGWRYPAAEEDEGEGSGGEAEAGAAAAADGMARIESWTEDKFTAMPTRTEFPQLSEVNHLLHEDAVSVAGGPAAVAPGVGSLEGEPTPVAPPLVEAPVGAEAAAPAGAPLLAGEGGRHVFSAPTPPRPGVSDDASPVRGGGEAAHAGSPGAASWTQPCVGHIDAAEALVLEPAGSTALSDGGDGWRETVDSPLPGGAAVTIDAKHGGGRRPLSPLTNGAHSGAADRAEDDAACSVSDDAATDRHVFSSKRPSDADDAPETRECLLGPPVRGILKQHDDGMREATKQCVLERLPPLLLMHLSRFEHVAAGARKRQGHVAFPFQLFVHPDVARAAPGAAHAPDAARYRLKAVLVHKGLRLDSGHYVSYVWRPTALVQAAAAALEWTPPGPSRPISIPQRGGGGAHQQRAGRRSHDGGTRGGHAPTRRGGALQASSLSGMQSGALSESDSAQSGTLATAQRSVSSQRTSLDGVWRAVSRRGAAGGASPVPLRGGSAMSAETGDDATVDWEELADQPVELRAAQRGASTLEAGSADSEGGEPAAEIQSSPFSLAHRSAMQSQDESGGADGAPALDNRSVAELLASESADDPGVWVLCDDEAVSAVPWQTVARASAYMLLYERV